MPVGVCVGGAGGSLPLRSLLKMLVLRNRLGLTDPAELSRAEADLTLVGLGSLAATPIEGSFDLAHLQAIHRFLFTPTSTRDTARMPASRTASAPARTPA